MHYVYEILLRIPDYFLNRSISITMDRCLNETPNGFTGYLTLIITLLLISWISLGPEKEF